MWIESQSRRATLEKLFARISDVATLPRVAQRVLEITHDESSRPSDLCDVIRYDPALMARVLRRVNSSYYGLRHRVADLNTAISLLGFHEIRSLAITVFLSRMFDRPSGHASYSREGLWTHCVAVAVTSRLVSNVSGAAKPEEAYVAGLLHDVGFILLDQHLKRYLQRIVEALDEQTPTTEVEQRILTFDHAQLGAFVTAQWNFAPQITDAIGYHHQPQGYLGSHRDLVYVVAIANYLCSQSGWTSLGVHNVARPHESVFAALGLDDVAMALICEELPEVLARAETLALS